MGPDRCPPARKETLVPPLMELLKLVHQPDAKLWPHVHPYGTGSVYSEPGAGGLHHHARNRLTNIQSWFRRSSSWGFWYLSRLIQAELFFKNSKRREFKKKTASAADEPDPVTRLFGTAMPSGIPESTAWWQRQTRDLLAASDDAEMGLMQVMVTLTANDTCPEMLACIRRGGSCRADLYRTHRVFACEEAKGPGKASL